MVGYTRESVCAMKSQKENSQDGPKNLYSSKPRYMDGPKCSAVVEKAAGVRPPVSSEGKRFRVNELLSYQISINEFHSIIVNYTEL